ncbi:MAG: WecB/TagA/CpsF family glycosyltransferase [Oscillospiraceae bacterium]|nr:WecB/TagA/CpsF family glycosyltransferase [Oscillospiraceae bacterium]
MRKEILGIGFDDLDFSQALETADALCRSGRGGSIVTANPELILHARKEKGLRMAAAGADLVLADGIGVLYAARILGTPLPERIAGADLVPALLSRLAARGDSVFLYGGKPGIARRAGEVLKRSFPGLGIAGTENGYISREEELLERIRASGPELLLLGLGAPRQELWMAEHREELPAVMIGVGGLLDVLAGDKSRAPERFQRLGLEWLYRLYREPRRFHRMLPLPGVLLMAGWERLKNGVPKDPDDRPVR